MNYIDLFKTRIKEEVKKVNGDKNFVDNLYPSIKDQIKIAGQCIGLSEVDEPTLKSYFQTAKNDYLSTNPIDPGFTHSLTKKGFKTWLTENRFDEISWDYSDRYFEYLLKNGRSEKVVEETKNSSLSILKKLADPKSKNAIYTKGLVVGAVQSGKTGNFNAVINRAIDSGYALVIVLSGIMEDLRSQTQKRIETDVIGEGAIDSTEIKGKKGVGEIRRFGPQGDSSIIQVQSITSERKDFGKSTEELDHTLNAKYVLVCKKNVSVLKNLIIWLHNSLEKGKEKHNLPLLILDDEADNASLNNDGAKGREYASKINGHIRAILEMFHIKTYLGYTATPFANVLQDRNEYPENDWPIKYKFKGEEQEKQLKRVDNIFPDDFIELLDPPSNYIGAKQIFETVKSIENSTDENEKLPLLASPVKDYVDQFPNRIYEDEGGEVFGVENIESKQDWEEKYETEGYLDFDSFADYRKGTRAPRKEDEFPKKLPESLKIAIKCFFLSLAIRESRKPRMENSKLFQPHNTMLIHTSRFTLWQITTKKLVEDYVNELISRINNDNPTHEDSIYAELQKIWYSDQGYAHIVENIRMYLPKDYEDSFMVPIVFDSLKNFLPDAVRGIEIKAINSITKEKLEYPKNSPKKYIAIGGNRLSRGFTLEGLTINYFIRPTNYSDALLQMGRWFGYRPGYLDCCKIFTTQDALDKFDSTTKCIEELEGEFVKMEEQGREPRNFVLRVKKHPGALKITRPSILKNAIDVKWSYQDQLMMSTRFNVSKNNIEQTWSNFTKNIAPKFNSQENGLLKFETSGEDVVNILKNQPNNFDQLDRNNMAKFIELCNERGLLENWTIALKTTGSLPEVIPFDYFNINPKIAGDIEGIKLARRSGPRIDQDVNTFLYKNIFKASSKSANIITSNEDMAILLSPSEKEKAKETFYRNKAKELQKKDNSLSYDEAIKESKNKTIPERYYREQMKESEGLLVIYLFNAEYAFNQKGVNEDKYHGLKKRFYDDYIVKHDIDTTKPLVGYAIEFPPIKDDPGGEYMQGDYNITEDEGEEGDGTVESLEEELCF
ncbi:MAG: Z1 domain-containing protein [Marinifilaceae bacterium]